MKHNHLISEFKFEFWRVFHGLILFLNLNFISIFDFCCKFCKFLDFWWKLTLEDFQLWSPKSGRMPASRGTFLKPSNHDPNSGNVSGNLDSLLADISSAVASLKLKSPNDQPNTQWTKLNQAIQVRRCHINLIIRSLKV